MAARGRASTASCRRPPGSASRSGAAIADGRVDRGVVDLAVERILRLKFRLGLFERPYVEAPSVAALDQLEARGADARGRARRRSIVLLENDGVLPLAADGGRIAVIGPIADSARDLIGDYATCRTSRRWPSCATGRTRSASRRAT